MRAQPADGIAGIIECKLNEPRSSAKRGVTDHRGVHRRAHAAAQRIFRARLTARGDPRRDELVLYALSHMTVPGCTWSSVSSPATAST